MQGRSKSKDHSGFQCDICQAWTQVSRYLSGLPDRCCFKSPNTGWRLKQGPGGFREKQGKRKMTRNSVFSKSHFLITITVHLFPLLEGEKVFHGESRAIVCNISLHSLLFLPTLTVAAQHYLPPALWHQLRILPRPWAPTPSPPDPPTKLSPGHDSSGEIPARNVSSPWTMGDSKRTRDHLICECDLRDRTNRDYKARHTAYI